MMNVYMRNAKQNKTRNTKIGLVSQKYYTNQKSFAHLYFQSENHVRVY